MNRKISTSQRPKSVESLASSSKVSKTLVSATKARKPGNSNIGDYQYEIDCQKVADSIDVTDLVSYFFQLCLQPLNLSIFRNNTWKNT